MAPHEKLIAAFDRVYNDESPLLYLHLAFVTVVMLLVLGVVTVKAGLPLLLLAVLAGVALVVIALFFARARARAHHAHPGHHGH
jgi:heme A synthase